MEALFDIAILYLAAALGSFGLREAARAWMHIGAAMLTLATVYGVLLYALIKFTDLVWAKLFRRHA